MKALRCKLNTAGNEKSLDCFNASNFHLSFFGFRVANATDKGLDGAPGMMKPRSRISLTVNAGDKMPQPPASVVFDFIDDIGATVAVESTLLIE
jgi:hypothetical protein